MEKWPLGQLQDIRWGFAWVGWPEALCSGRRGQLCMEEKKNNLEFSYLLC